jgi:hypothetical protein
MKVKKVVLVFVVSLSLVAMSCSQHACPAYGQKDNNSGTEEKA